MRPRNSDSAELSDCLDRSAGFGQQPTVAVDRFRADRHGIASARQGSRNPDHQVDAGICGLCAAKSAAGLLHLRCQQVPNTRSQNVFVTPKHRY